MRDTISETTVSLLITLCMFVGVGGGCEIIFILF